MARPALTPEERILAMKERVARKREQEQREQLRQRNQEYRLEEGSAALLEALKSLSDMPVKPNGSIDITYQPGSGVLVRRIGWQDVNNGAENDREVLIAFRIATDYDGERWWLEHDGDEVDLGTALDLAVEVVERILDA